MPRGQSKVYGQQFDPQRTKAAHGDLSALRESIINMSMPAGTTHFDDLLEISRSSQDPFKVKHLSEKLKKIRSVRGRTHFGRLAEVIEGIVLNYPTLRWWMEEDGLVVDEVQSGLARLSEFDRVAGPLVLHHTKGNKLSKSALESIAEELDAKGLQLKKTLQPAQWRPISEYNQKHSRSAIKTFSGAIARPMFVRNVRRRLYPARDRYKRAIGLI